MVTRLRPVRHAATAPGARGVARADSFELRGYESSNQKDYLRLLREAWGEQALTQDEFEWWFGRSPVGNLMSVARKEGRVVGVASHSLFEMMLDGEEALASFSVHATTQAAVRGEGIFVALEAKHEREAQERGVAVALAFASAPTAPLFLGPLGWTEIARLRIWACPVTRFAARGSAPLERFDHDGDAAADWPNHVVRDARYLNWRYLDAPRDYIALGRGNGYAVVRHKLLKGRRVALITDLVAEDPRPLLRACSAAVRPGTHFMLALPPHEHRRAYLSVGFVPTPRSLHFMGKSLAGRLDTDPRAWRLTLGDTDFF